MHVVVKAETVMRRSYEKEAFTTFKPATVRPIIIIVMMMMQCSDGQRHRVDFQRKNIRS